MPERPPLPYDFLPAVPSFAVESDDIADGRTLGEAQLHDGWGVSGQRLSPQLRWSGFPAETRGFAVTCFDPDAPTGAGFWHWILFDLPASVTALPTGAGTPPDFKGLPEGAVHGRNDFGSHDFGGAAPPKGHGPHRYVFAVHALRVDTLGLPADMPTGPIGFTITANTIARGMIIPEFGH